jgi:SNF2 family DNA or RNA helicase
MPREYGALYTTMGSGKTKIMIDLILNRSFKRTIIVATSGICKRGTWDQEIFTHAPEGSIFVLNPSKIEGVKRPSWVEEKRKLSKEFKQEVIIVSYSSIWREPFKSYLLKKYKPDCIICDESHKIKTPGSKCSKMLTQLGKRTPNRFLMTGTPLGQSPLDIYAQYRFLCPEIFGTNFDKFKQLYTNQVVIPGLMFTMLDKKNPYKNLEQLHEKMFSCAFMMEPEDLELPATSDIIVEFEMGKEARQYYKELKKEGCLELEQGVVETSNVLTVITRLQQLCSGYLKVEDDDKKRKLVQVDDSRQKTFKDILDSIPDFEPVIVWAKYRKDIKNIRKLVEATGRKAAELSGSRDTVDEWVNNKATVLIMQISSGAEGLNELTKARYNIYYTLTHSLIQYHQSRKRTHRPGQTRSVIYYMLVARAGNTETIDQKILKSLQNNQDVIDVVMKNKEI